ETGTSRERRGAFYTLHDGAMDATGTLMAWAWGVSRLVDVIAAHDALLRADAVAVTGCSRWGKGALAAGAFDPRIALTIPIESGTGGVPVWRAAGEGGAQSPASAWGEQPWLGDGFAPFAQAPWRLAIDQHAVLALVAPRGLLVLDNPHVDWLGARHGHLSALAAAEVYAALGAAGNLGYHGDVADGRHCAWREEWTGPARGRRPAAARRGRTCRAARRPPRLVRAGPGLNSPHRPGRERIGYPPRLVLDYGVGGCAAGSSPETGSCTEPAISRRRCSPRWSRRCRWTAWTSWCCRRRPTWAT